MNIISSYKAQIVSENVFKPTVVIYRSALAYLIEVFQNDWDAISAVEGSLKRQNFAEKLIHSTRFSKAKYEYFDKIFYKMPTYMRRSVVCSALGAVSAYRIKLMNWENAGKVGKAPKLQYERNAMPVFYRYNMYLPTSDPDTVELKLFLNNDWRWVQVRLRHTDMKYLEKKWSGVESCAPVLEEHRIQRLTTSFQDTSYQYGEAAPEPIANRY